MNLRGEQLRLGSKQGPNWWRIAFLLAMIGFGVWILRLQNTGQVRPLFLPTPTTTRTANSYADEAGTHLSAGNMARAVSAYQNAVQVQPEEAALWAELARAQTYYSALQANREDRLARLAEARQSIERAVGLAPDDSFIQAVRALVYDWSASAFGGDNTPQFDSMLKEASESSIRAMQLDPESVRARAFRAEVLVDQGDYVQAFDLAEQAALDAEENAGTISTDARVDAHRVFGLVLENNGSYRQAIEEYDKAIQINPNLTFLYLRKGANYRRLAGSATTGAVRDNLIDQALAAFDQAARINEQNEIQDPIPYLAIGRTYLQEGEFFVAARNVERAVTLDPGNPDLYGFLGIVYYKGRNYESALEVLECAVEGCSQEETGDLLCNVLQIILCEEGTSLASYGEVVPGQRLGTDSLEHYYTYASALAFMDFCDQAEPLFQQLMTAYGSDPTVAAIVAENRAICSASGDGSPNTAPSGPNS